MADSPVTRTLSIEDRDEAVILFGPRDSHLRVLRNAWGVKAVYRNGELKVEGTTEGVEHFARSFEQLRHIARKKGQFDAKDVTDVIEVVQAGTARGGEAVVATEGGRSLRTRTDGQGRYVQALQQHDVVICVGPAGSGKTYLAVAWAVALLKSKQVRKIVLVRPAVEAGERLGFLPGDLVAKISPYLRPLYDALADMMEPATVEKYMETEVIEILPLAYMHHPRRGAELDRDADEDVPDADGGELEDHRDRRHDANRPAAHRQERPRGRGPPPARRGGAVDRVPGSERHRAQPAGDAHREGVRGRRPEGTEAARVRGPPMKSRRGVVGLGERGVLRVSSAFPVPKDLRNTRAKPR